MFFKGCGQKQKSEKQRIMTSSPRFVMIDDSAMMVILGFDDIRRNRVGQIDDRHGLQDDAPGSGQLDVA